MNKAQALLETLAPLYEVENVHVNFLKTVAGTLLKPPIRGSVDIVDKKGLVREYVISGYSNSDKLNLNPVFQHMTDHFQTHTKYPAKSVETRFTVNPTVPPNDKQGKHFYKLIVTVGH